MNISATLMNYFDVKGLSMKQLFASTVLIMLLLSCASTDTKDKLQQASAHYQLGVSYLNDNNIEPAFVEFQKALELNPKDKDSLNALGIIYLQKLENYPKAIEYFKAALKIDKSFSEAANNLGNAYAKMGKYNDAIATYKRAIENPLYKNASLALYNLGMVYYRVTQYDEAINSFKEALKRFSNFSLPYYGLSLCYNAQGQYGDAASAIAHAIKYDALYQGDREKAIEEIKNKKLLATGDELKDLSNYLDILRY